MPMLWILFVAAAVGLTWWVSAPGWLWVMVGIASVVPAAWHSVRQRVRLQCALADANRRHMAMRQALRRSQRMEVLGRLTAGAAHDFNNHLTVISSNLEMIRHRLHARGLANGDLAAEVLPGGDLASGDLATKSLENDGLKAVRDRLSCHIDGALQGVRRAAVLTGRLLAFSSRAPIEPEPVDVGRLLSDLSDLLPHAMEGRIRLDLELCDSPWFSLVDINQMEIALLSLVLHAGDQVPDNGVMKITVSNAALDPVIAAANPPVRPGDFVQIAISGASRPMPARHWDDVAGADLFMVTECARQAGGCLLRTCSVQAGFSIRLFLPRHISASVAASGSRPRQNRGATILVVEDEAEIRTACAETLRALGYEVLEAPDAMKAFEIISANAGIDLLFTDLNLPGGVSGRTLADAVHNVDPGMRILFTTGYATSDLPARGIAALLRKPFDLAQLAASVKDALATERPVDRSEVVRG